MNYRHGFHAGNFADVLKHVVFVACLEDLARSAKPVSAIDTHAGAGLYDLSGNEAQKTGEWQSGVGRLWDSPAAPSLVRNYLGAISAFQPQRGQELRTYPGSPLLAAHTLRPGDRLTALELHPPTFALLRNALRKTRAAQALCADGYAYLKQMPDQPLDQGLILIDPPFEAANEFERFADCLKIAYERWPSCRYVLWYPAKDLRAVARFEAELTGHAIANFLCVSLSTGAEGEGLTSCRVGVINPPARLHDDLTQTLPWLRERLSQGAKAGFQLTWLGAPE